MTASQSLAPIAVWFIAGMARIVFTSAMVEHRIDRPDPSQAIAFTVSAASARQRAENYDRQGQRLLPWYRAVTSTYWMVVAVCVGWAILR
jgi:hypothetical protein